MIQFPICCPACLWLTHHGTKAKRAVRCHRWRNADHFCSTSSLFGGCKWFHLSLFGRLSEVQQERWEEKSAVLPIMWKRRPSGPRFLWISGSNSGSAKILQWWFEQKWKWCPCIWRALCKRWGTQPHVRVWSGCFPLNSKCFSTHEKKYAGPHFSRKTCEAECGGWPWNSRNTICLWLWVALWLGFRTLQKGHPHFPGLLTEPRTGSPNL